MLTPFFATAMRAPARQRSFRYLAVAHVAFLAVLAQGVSRATEQQSLEIAGNLLLILGIVEGAAIIGWRLTQLPKSQALEFLLTSPVQPKRVFLAEAMVGVARFSLVWLAGLPILLGLAVLGYVEPIDILALGGLPYIYGMFAGFGLTAWVYEPVAIRRIGEMIGLFGVVIYLIVGVLAGENLLQWLMALPNTLRDVLYHSIIFLTSYNPFGVVRYWFLRDDPFYVPEVAWVRMQATSLFAGLMIVATGMRGMYRLQGHFHDRHYKPISSRRASQQDRIGDRPLTWWAVRRVMEYSGQVNLWLAIGFAILYAAFIIAGDRWPPWLGKAVFQLFDKWGGAPVVTCALCVLAAVPAVFQYGLWDPTIQDRCRRLELLVLTDLTPQDYWHASASAAWARGYGYLIGAALLWVALGVSGTCSEMEVIAAVAGAGMLWCFSFAVGFRAFATGIGGGSIALVMTLGMPALLIGLLWWHLGSVAAFTPIGLCYLPVAPQHGVTEYWILAMAVYGVATITLTHRGQLRCDADLRAWLNAHQGRISST
ncbi:MAG: hypothetical protein LC104_05420 [Bacteroidales bacterium]|nr:hypothetical protein [Bacteroidales bacterium]